MRSRHRSTRYDDADLWGDLYERFRGPGDPSRGRRGRRLGPESSALLIDAALGILGAVRTFVDVAEDILEERRTQLGDDGPHREPWLREDAPAHPPTPVTDPTQAVRDIPMAGS